jgi:hypothetical protein
MTEILNKLSNGYSHWCEACQRQHIVPDDWVFNNNMASPTFTPSIKISYPNGYGRLDPDNGPLPKDYICHYSITDGSIIYHSDCTHRFASKILPLIAQPPRVERSTNE